MCIGPVSLLISIVAEAMVSASWASVKFVNTTTLSGLRLALNSGRRARSWLD